MFQQTKYALEGRASLAIVGGLVEPGEDPAVAARREVAEEAGQRCAQWQSLGRFRTDVNRGLGWTHTYLARDCTTTTINNNNNNPSSESSKSAQQQQHPRDSTVTADEVVGAADTERQDVKIMSLSEVRKALQAGEFLEIQWTATIALAMLYYEQHDDG